MGMWSRNTYYSDYCNKRSCVYRLYADSGELLYIGMSLNPEGRVAQHRSKQPWGKEIDHYTCRWFPNREAAKAAERSAIHHEDPLYNLSRPRMECC
jgi:predicted GIY-YIG superfamily endonuclease